MLRIEIDYVFEVELDKQNLDKDFYKIKAVVESDSDKFVLSNKHLLKENKIYYDLME